MQVNYENAPYGQTVGGVRLSKNSFQLKDSEGRIVGKGTVRVPFP